MESDGQRAETVQFQREDLTSVRFPLAGPAHELALKVLGNFAIHSHDLDDDPWLPDMMLLRDQHPQGTTLIVEQVETALYAREAAALPHFHVHILHRSFQKL